MTWTDFLREGSSTEEWERHGNDWYLLYLPPGTGNSSSVAAWLTT